MENNHLNYSCGHCGNFNVSLFVYLFVVMFRWNIYENEDPFGQLKWMVNVLEQAEQKNESVHILAHIPTEQCLEIWSREFNRIVDR